MKVIGLIPSRINSKRLFNKALLEIEGLPLVVHTFKRALLSVGSSRGNRSGEFQS